MLVTVIKGYCIFFEIAVFSLQLVVTLDLLSTHSPDEEYLGEEPEASWVDDPVIFAAYERFKGILILVVVGRLGKYPPYPYCPKFTAAW